MKILTNLLDTFVGVSLTLFCTSFATAQPTYTIKKQKFKEYNVFFQGNDTIKFLINETNFNFEKPTAIYFNGSYPTPLIIEWEEGPWD